MDETNDDLIDALTASLVLGCSPGYVRGHLAPLIGEVVIGHTPTGRQRLRYSRALVTQLAIERATRREQISIVAAARINRSRDRAMRGRDS